MSVPCAKCGRPVRLTNYEPVGLRGPFCYRCIFDDQQRSARESLARLREIYPGAFDEHGNALVATAHLPRKPQ